MAIIFIFPYIYYYIKRKSIALVIYFGFLSNIYFLFPGNQNFFGITYQITDLGIFALLFSIVFEKIVNKKVILQPSPAHYKLFIIFLILLILVDILIFKNSLSSILTTRRIHLFILMFIYFNYFDKTEIESGLNYIINITKISFPIYFLQFIISTQIFQGNTTESEFVAGTMRYGNFPAFTLPFLFLLFFNKNIKNKYLWLVITVSAIILSASRSILIGMSISILLVYIINFKNFYKFAIVLVLFLPLYILAINFLPDFSARMTEGVNEINYVIDNISGGEIVSKGNFSYRMAFLIERIDYLSRDYMNIIFGIGGISEQNLQHSLFKIGIIDETTGLTQQLNTGDTAWAVLFLRFGFLGTLIYLLTIFFPLLKGYLKFGRNNFANAGLSYLLFLFIRTFATAELATLEIYFAPLLFYYLAKDYDSK